MVKKNQNICKNGKKKVCKMVSFTLYFFRLYLKKKKKCDFETCNGNEFRTYVWKDTCGKIPQADENMNATINEKKNA